MYKIFLNVLLIDLFFIIMESSSFIFNNALLSAQNSAALLYIIYDNDYCNYVIVLLSVIHIVSVIICSIDRWCLSPYSFHITSTSVIYLMSNISSTSSALLALIQKLIDEEFHWLHWHHRWKYFINNIFIRIIVQICCWWNSVDENWCLCQYLFLTMSAISMILIKCIITIAKFNWKNVANWSV